MGYQCSQGFLRKWYHTRSKRVQAVSLEACIEDEDGSIHEIEDVSCAFENHIIAEDYCKRFMECLSARVMEILELRSQGFKYKEIGEKLGYKNPSGVIKRMQAITKMFLKYEGEQQ